MSERHISVPKPFASGEVSEWFTRYEICCKANGWNDEQKALKLPTLLEGEALALWLELAEEEQKDYKTAKEKLVLKMKPPGFISLNEFHQRKMRLGESLSLFVHDLKKLLIQAMPNLDSSAVEQLLLHQFLAGLPPTVSRQLRSTGETKTLEEAIERARLLLVITDQEQTAAVQVQRAEVQQLQDKITALTQQVAALTTRPQRPRMVRCFECNQVGHLRRNCPNNRQQWDRRRCFICDRPGHVARECRQGNDYGASGQGNRRPFSK